MEEQEKEKKQNTASKLISGIVTTIISILIIIFCFTSCNVGSENDNKNQYYIGDTVSDGKVSVTITSVKNTQSISWYDTDDNYVVIYFSVTNNSNSAISFNPLYCSLKMGETTFEYVTYHDDIYDIVAGGTKQGLYIAFETVKTTDQATYVVELGYSILNMNCFKIILKNKT